MANIEMNYYNGESYEVLYPLTIASQVSGTLSTNQIPNLDMSKITTGNLAGSRISGSVSSATNASYATSAGNSSTVGGYSYSQIISNAGISKKYGSYTGTGSNTTITINIGVVPTIFSLISNSTITSGSFSGKVGYICIRVTSTLMLKLEATGSYGNFSLPQFIYTTDFMNSSSVSISVSYTSIFNNSGMIYYWMAF